MSIGVEGQNLIFLISQPRAGSTMTQRILGSHPDIYTVSEPWLMLQPLYGLRYEGYDAEYNASWARAITQEFFRKIPNHEETYFQGLRQMYSYIYNTALSSSDKSFFLDKTPRYYWIISELKQAFPDADFIILLRNPLAVFVSIITTWIDKEWSNLENFKHDLIKAPKLLVEGIGKLGKNCQIIHYEKLIAKPHEEIQRTCKAMGLEFFPEMIEYGVHNSTKWKFGDQKLVYQKTRPDAQNLDKWILSLENPQIWQAASDYLEFLGHEIIYQMGYSYRELRNTLDANHPQEVDWAKISRVEWLQRQPGQHQESPQTSLGYAVMAKKNERKGKLVEATTAYRKTIELNPTSAWSYFNLGEALAKQQKWDEAIAAYQQAIKLNPNSASFYYNLAEAFMQQGNLDEAIAHYSKALEIKPTFSIGHNSLGEALVKQGKLVEAVGCFRKAVELNSNYFRAYGNLADILAEKGQLEEAVGFYQEAIKLNPSYQITNPKLREAVG